ncbi:MAG TPA: carbohydrate-binding family 9-like protein [Blastocatellia bacterium]|nr:carbohydrate-binding family 9-like protein [Blastocatellia bacterium]
MKRTSLLIGLFALCALFLLATNSPMILADEAGVAVSHQAKADFKLTADPASAAWKKVPAFIMDKGRRGENMASHKTEIRSQWTAKNLYLLFSCPYEELSLKPNPTTTAETDKLWEWDVAEVFIGTDFNDIKHYTEFQVSPQGEWVDLDIDRKPDPPKHNVSWNSGYEVKARIDQAKKIWYGEMRIPMDKIDKRPAKAGNEMRINFYRIQAPKPNRVFINWQPVNSDNYHTPEAFGRLRLSDK